MFQCKNIFSGIRLYTSHTDITFDQLMVNVKLKVQPILRIVQYTWACVARG